MTAVRSHNTTDNDIIVLMTFVFAVAEVLLLIFAISNLFAGLFYLGERCEARALITPYKLGRGTMTPEALRAMAYIFATAKTALCFLPETLRLSKTVTIGSGVYVQYLSKIYPFVLISALLISFIAGILFIRMAKGYVLAIAKEGEGGFAFASEAMYALNKEATDRKRHTARIFSALTALTVGSIFSAEIVFEKFHEINVLPHCVYGAFIMLGALMLSREISNKGKKLALIFGIFYCAVSVVAFVAGVKFLMKYTYQDLLLGDFVKAEYIPVIIFSIVELLFLIALLSVSALINRRFILTYTGTDVNLPTYNVADRDFHRSLILRGYILHALAAFSGISKLVGVLLKFNVEIIFATQGDSEIPIVATSVPWWNTVVYISAAAYIIYAFIYYSSLKEEVKIKLQA